MGFPVIDREMERRNAAVTVTGRQSWDAAAAALASNDGTRAAVTEEFGPSAHRLVNRGPRPPAVGVPFSSRSRAAVLRTGVGAPGLTSLDELALCRPGFCAFLSRSLAMCPVALALMT